MIRIIQVGLGVRGIQWADVIRKHPDTTVVAYVRRQVDLARKQVAEWGETVPCFSTLDEALDSVTADAVVLVTPPEYHFAEVLLAFSHRCHVICEKPLSEKMCECIEMVRQAEQNKLLLMAGMNFRYLAVTQKYRNLINEKTLGSIGYGHFTYIRNRNGNRKDLNKYPLLMLQPMLLEQSVHHFDLLRYCYGEEACRVSAETWRPYWSTYDDDCCVSASIRFTHGIQAEYLGTWTSGCNRMQFEWRTDFSGGTIRQCHQFGDLYQSRMDPELSMTGANFKTDPGIEPWKSIELDPCEAFVDDTYGLLCEFVDAFQGDKELVTSGKDHMKTLGLTLACIESSLTGKRIELHDFYKRNGVPSRWID
ncbi:MAG TPA: Gfo/Idh/MocA family oxidoreductase [Dysgonamonadaceae bacterium]|nr:Gfo/Idh/MocA family oxidoreductase [Dysgonamonadaceae bacterium]